MSFVYGLRAVCHPDRVQDDGRKLFGDFGILAQNLVELGGLAREADPKCKFTRSITALATVVEKYAGKHLDKGRVRSSNWEEMPLSREQLECKNNMLSSLRSWLSRFFL